MTHDPTIWTTVYGKKIPIEKMGFSHARNTLEHLETRKAEERDDFIDAAERMQRRYENRIAKLDSYVPHLEARVAREWYPGGKLVTALLNRWYTLSRPKSFVKRRRYGR